MGRLSSPEQVRMRAAECRARADHPILRPDAAAWLELADTWDRLAEAMEASAEDGRLDYARAGDAEQAMGKTGAKGATPLVRGDAPPTTAPRDPDRGGRVDGSDALLATSCLANLGKRPAGVHPAQPGLPR